MSYNSRSTRITKKLWDELELIKLDIKTRNRIERVTFPQAADQAGEILKLFRLNRKEKRKKPFDYELVFDPKL